MCIHQRWLSSQFVPTDPWRVGETFPASGTASLQESLRGVKQVQASDEAFAAILSDGSVVSWGQFRSGGDSTAVQMQLQDARELHATRTAFAALLGNGSVVTWGHADGGGDSSAVQGQLRDVQELRATASAFVAFLLDGSAIVSGASLVMCVYVAVLHYRSLPAPWKKPRFFLQLNP